MRNIFLFMNVSVDGFFEGPGHDISAFNQDFDAFSSEAGQEVDTILLGRRTYEMMASFWPTPQAKEMVPDIAAFMNEKQKVVATRNGIDANWQNTTVIGDDVATEIKQLKEQPGKNIIMMGSNNLCVSLMQEGLVDEFQIMVNPVALGEGTTLFKGLPQRADLVLKDSRAFDSGAVLLTYHPAQR